MKLLKNSIYISDDHCQSDGFEELTAGGGVSLCLFAMVLLKALYTI